MKIIVVTLVLCLLSFPLISQEKNEDFKRANVKVTVTCTDDSIKSRVNNIVLNELRNSCDVVIVDEHPDLQFDIVVLRITSIEEEMTFGYALSVLTREFLYWNADSSFKHDQPLCVGLMSIIEFYGGLTTECKHELIITGNATNLDSISASIILENKSGLLRKKELLELLK